MDPARIAFESLTLDPELENSLGPKQEVGLRQLPAEVRTLAREAAPRLATKRELPGLLSEIVQPLQAERLAQNQKLLAYQATPLTDQQADHAIMDLYRNDVIGVQAIAHVLKTYDEPPHDWGGRTAWRLFNASTFALAGKVSEKPDLTRLLHQVIDGVCHEVV